LFNFFDLIRLFPINPIISAGAHGRSRIVAKKLFVSGTGAQVRRLEAKILWGKSMPLDKAFLTGAIEGITDEQAEKILKEHDSDITGLKVNRDQVLSESKGYKEKLEKLTADVGTKEAEYKKQIEELEGRIKASSTEETKAFYEAEKKKLQEIHSAQIAETDKKYAALEAERTALYSEYLEVLKNTELDKAMDSVQNLNPRRKNSLRYEFWARNKFEHQEVEGVKKLMNSEFRSVSDVLNAFLATDEGKEYLINNNSGGGAAGSTHGSQPGKPNTMPRERFDGMTPQEKMDFVSKGGTIG
jgi:hypothetical protein